MMTRFPATVVSCVAAALSVWPASGQDLSAILEDPVAFRDAVLDIAKPKIRLQLMPQEYRDLGPPVLWFPFSNDVIVGLVLDSELGYQYLTNDHASPPTTVTTPRVS